MEALRWVLGKHASFGNRSNREEQCDATETDRGVVKRVAETRQSMFRAFISRLPAVTKEAGDGTYHRGHEDHAS